MNQSPTKMNLTLSTPPPAPAPAFKRSPLYQLVRYLLRPMWIELKHIRAIRKYAHHADSRSFEWQWTSTHFNRIATVNLLLSRWNNPAYLEIGCASNALFDSVPTFNKVGVDPAAGGTIRATSDEFFRSNQAKFDVVFIDGLHTCEQVRRDVVNSINSLNDGGFIAMHDLLPRNWIEHHNPDVTRAGAPWTGDVWKVAFELAQTEGIDFKILKIDCGVGVLKVLKPGVVLKDLSSELRDKEFSYFYENIDRLPIVDWEDAYDWLASGSELRRPRAGLLQGANR